MYKINPDEIPIETFIEKGNKCNVKKDAISLLKMIKCIKTPHMPTGMKKFLYDITDISRATYRAIIKYTGRKDLASVPQIKIPRYGTIIITGKWTREFGRR